MELYKRIIYWLKKPLILFVNLLGLSLGIAACLLILLFVKYEQSFDKHYEKSDQIYRLRFTKTKGSQVMLDAINASPPMGPTFKKDIPGIIHFVRLTGVSEYILKVDEQLYEEKRVFYVDSSYFEVFSNKFLHGNKESCLSRPYTAVLSSSSSQKYFGKQDPVGKIININNKLFEITGVYQDMPLNSHFHFDILLSYSTPNWLNKKHSNTWDMFFTVTYFLIDKKANLNELEAKATEIANNKKPLYAAEQDWKIRFQPLEDIHLHTSFSRDFEEGGNATMNVILTIAAFIILSIAWFNYASLATAQSLDRAKEIGIKKVLGINKGKLIKGVVIESFVLNLIAMLLAFSIVILIKPYFETLLEVEMSFQLWDLGFIALLFGIFTIGIFLSGIYPALVISTFNPSQVLKGKIGISNDRIGFRKVLLGFQFALSAFLILTTLVVYLQSKLLLNNDIGVDISNVLVLKGSNLKGKDFEFDSKIESFKQALVQHSEIISTSNSNSIPANTGFIDGVYSDIQRPEEESQFSILFIGPNFLQNLGVEPIEGRLFSEKFPSDNRAAIISRSAITALGFNNPKDAIHHKTTRGNGDKNKEIIGVIDDFQLNSCKEVSYPMIFYLKPGEKKYFVIKLDRPINKQIINKVENVWNEYFGNELFRYFDLEDSYQALYKNDARISKVLAFFAFLGILVAFVGLWGMVYFTISKRTKEIGIRRVLGVSKSRVIIMVNYEFMKIVFIALLFVTPLSWCMAAKWLQSFATKINMSWWLALIPFIAISAITILVISFYTMKTASINPSEVMRDE